MSANASNHGKVTIVEIRTPETDRVVCTMVELSLNGETLTISDDQHDLTDDIRELAHQLVDQVRQQYGTNTDR